MKENRTNRDFWTSWAEEASACMDYLHGITIDNEFEAACIYEFGRESIRLRDLASQVSRQRREPNITAEMDALTAIGQDDSCPWFIQPPWSEIWTCPSFPSKAWNLLSDDERHDILRSFVATGVQPLHRTNAAMLAAMGIFEQFKRTGNPVAENEGWVYALFTLDFGKTKKRLVDEFAAWLDLPENQGRFKKHRRDPIGKTGTFKDHLKALATWRLYDKLGFDGMLKFSEANRRRAGSGMPLAFHDARKGQGRPVPLNQAPLCSEQSFAEKAKARAKAYMAQIIPWETESSVAAKRHTDEWIKSLPQIPKGTT